MKIYVHASSDFDNMTYSEFKDKYRDILKKYPDLTAGFGSSSYIYVMQKDEYEKSGRSWELVDSTTEEVSFEEYMNVISAGPFFKNLGGSERITKSYSKLGLVPVEVTSISPDRTQKSVWKFKIK